MVAPSLAHSPPPAAPMSLFDYFKVEEKTVDSFPKVTPKPTPSPEMVVFCHPTTGDTKTGVYAPATALVKSALGPIYESVGPLIAVKSNGDIEITETTTFAEIAEDGRAWIGIDLRRRRCKRKA